MDFIEGIVIGILIGTFFPALVIAVVVVGPSYDAREALEKMNEMCIENGAEGWDKEIGCYTVTGITVRGDKVITKFKTDIVIE